MHNRTLPGSILLLLLAALLLFPPGLLRAQAPVAAPNRVLQLTDGKSYVELPPNIFDALTQATVEGWVRWENLEYRRFFDFGDKGLEMHVRGDGPQMNFLVTEPGGTRHRIEVAGILKKSEWCHVAAVTGPGGAKLYFNGTLVGSHAYTGSFSGFAGKHNYLGKSNFNTTDGLFIGAMDEVRVWDHERTAEEIRAGMFQTLNGSEKGLAGYWNFDDGTAKDASPGKHDGTLNGVAAFGEEALPAKDSLRAVEVAHLAGKVTGPDGTAANMDVFVREGSRRLARARADKNGEYRVSVVTGTGPVDVYASARTHVAGETGIILKPGDERRVDLQLQPAQLAGRVLSADGQPLPGIALELIQSKEDTAAFSALTTEAEGVFNFGAQPPGRYLVRAVLTSGPVLYNDGKPLEITAGTVLTGLEFKLPESAAVPVPPAQPASVAGPFTDASNRVLVLDSKDACVELPPNIFNDLSEITVEGWVKWDRFQKFSRFFDFGSQSRAFLVGQHGVSQDLEFHIWPNPSGFLKVTAAGVLKAGEWQHVAAVADQKGFRFYLNGAMVGESSWAAPLYSIGREIVGQNQPADPVKFIASGEHNYLGRSNWRDAGDSDLNGEMDEVRVWKVARTAEEIRENITKKLTGSEEGLAGLWNFDDPANPGRDASPHHHDGKLMGNARAIDGATLQARPGGKDALVLDNVNFGITSPKGWFADVSDNFTMEFWALPTLARGEKGSIYPGNTGQRYVLHPSHGTLDLGGDPHAGVGVSLGTNGVAVVEHADSYMPLYQQKNHRFFMH